MKFSFAHSIMIELPLSNVVIGWMDRIKVVRNLKHMKSLQNPEKWRWGYPFLLLFANAFSHYFSTTIVFHSPSCEAVRFLPVFKINCFSNSSFILPHSEISYNPIKEGAWSCIQREPKDGSWSIGSKFYLHICLLYHVFIVCLTFTSFRQWVRLKLWRWKLRWSPRGRLSLRCAPLGRMLR